MRIYLAFTVLSSIVVCFGDFVQDQTKLLKCKIKTLQNREKICNLQEQKINDEGFAIVPSKFGEEVKIFEVFWNREVEFLPEQIAKTFPNLIRYHVILCAIKRVDEKHFHGLLRLESLELKQNEVETIASDSFKDLKKLKHLDLKYNKIKFIDAKWFESLTHLKHLTLHSNEIEFLNEKSFEKLTNLQSIHLSDNKLKSIPGNVFKNNLKLQVIWLHDNNIENIISSMFDYLTELKNVDLRSNICMNRTYRKDSSGTLFKSYPICDLKKDLEESNCTMTIINEFNLSSVSFF